MKKKRVTTNILKAIIFIAIIFFGNHFNLNAQTTTAKELYNGKFYQSALEKFNQILEQSNNVKNGKKIDVSEIEGYKVLCLINLNSPNSENAIKNYEKSYPYSTMLGKIKFKQATKLFDSGDFSQTMEILNTIDKRSLSKEEREEFVFRKGYCQMRVGDNPGAINTFTAVITSNSQTYLWAALYYCGYLHYINKDFEKAIPLFERAKKDNRFAVLSQYHILESKFLLKDHNYVITNGPALYETIDDNYKSKVARIISEAYYALNDTAKAKYYFELYSMSGANLSKTDNFYAGMIAYTLNNHISATDAFSKVASATDSIGQSAAYHLGQSYIQLKNKHEAQKAFKLAAESTFDKSIQEDAFFNYAKLSFDINRDIAPFEEYMKSYSYTNQKWDEIHSYIATEFLMNSNYADAIESLKKIKNPNAATTINLQKASFFRAIQLIRNGSYSKAIPYLQESVNNSTYNTSLKLLAEFWLAECYYRKDQFTLSEEILAALQNNTKFRESDEYPTSVYNKAYSQFKRGAYDDAAKTFAEYLQFAPASRPYSNEANTRLADCKFMLKDYLSAAELYEIIAINDGYKTLYAPLQSAISYGLINENTKKVALLNEITGSKHISSPLYSTALYELGRTHVQNVEDNKAEEVLNKLINNPKDSTYYYKALLEMGMINANKQNYDKALEYYKTIVDKKPISEEAQSALAGIENIYQTKNKPEEFLSYLDKIGLSATKTEDEKENMLFNSAEQIFLSENYTDALNSLNSFVAKYPSGTKISHANFYIAECYNKLGRNEKAANSYRKVMEGGEGAFQEIATLNYAKLSYKLEKFQDAVEAYETLDKIAQLDNNRLEAKRGLIQSYYMNKNYSKSLIEADVVLSAQDVDNWVKEMAKYYKAKSCLALGEREKALPLLKEISKDVTSDNGAEAAYLLILDAYDAGDFDSVEQQTFALSDSGTPQAYWLAKSFIVLGDSYAERDNLEQAQATFNSIKENYTPQGEDDIADLLKIRLNKLAQMKK